MNLLHTPKLLDTCERFSHALLKRTLVLEGAQYVLLNKIVLTDLVAALCFIRALQSTLLKTLRSCVSYDYDFWHNYSLFKILLLSYHGLSKKNHLCVSCVHMLFIKLQLYFLAVGILNTSFPKFITRIHGRSCLPFQAQRGFSTEFLQIYPRQMPKAYLISFCHCSIMPFT